MLNFYDHDCDRARALGEQAFNNLRTLHTPAVPPNYELFYLFATGSNKALNEAVRKALADKHQLTAEEARELCAAYLGAKEIDERLGEAGHQLDNEIDDILRHIDSAAHCTRTFGEVLTKVSGQLHQLSDPRQVKIVVEKIIEASRRMIADTGQLHNRLDESRRQISELQENLDAVRTESTTDALTCIANRKQFDRTLAEAIETARSNGQPMSLLMMDIDHFKRFNDTFGHQAGDGVLRLVASAMKASVKGRDLVARYGGEEFSAILPATNLQAAYTVAEQIRKAVMGKELIKKSSGESLGNVTLSIGAAMLGADETAEQLIGRADSYLYAAKKSGRNQVRTDDDDSAESAPVAAVTAA